MRVKGISLACAGLLLGACGSGKKTVNFEGAKATTTSAPAAAGASATATTAASGPGTTAGRSTQAAPATTTTARAGSATTAAGATGRVGAPPGHYTYDRSGSQTGGTPPTTGNLSDKVSLTIDPPNGTDQHSSLTPQGSATPQTEEVFRYTAGQILFIDLKVNQLGKEFTPNPPVQASPEPAQVGQKWSWDMTSTDKSTTLHGDFSYTATDTLTIGGRSVPVFVMSGVLTFHLSSNGAPITVTDTQTEWVSPQLYLQVKLHDVLDAGAFGHSDTTSLLESVTPS